MSYINPNVSISNALEDNQKNPDRLTRVEGLISSMGIQLLSAFRVSYASISSYKSLARNRH